MKLLQSFQIRRVVLLTQQQMEANDIMTQILAHFNIQKLVLVDMEITKNASGALKQTNMHLLSR